MEQKTRASGFASMDRHKQKEIARKGGMAAHKKGTAHEFTSDEARDAGRKGGQQVSANRSHMIEIGRLGGRRSAERRRIKAAEGTASPWVAAGSTRPTANRDNDVEEVVGEEMLVETPARGDEETPVAVTHPQHNSSQQNRTM